MHAYICTCVFRKEEKKSEAPQDCTMFERNIIRETALFLLHSEGLELGKYYKRDFAGFGNYTRITALPWSFITLSHVFWHTLVKKCPASL